MKKFFQKIGGGDTAATEGERGYALTRLIAAVVLLVAASAAIAGLSTGGTGTGGGASVDDTVYDATAWNGVTTIAPSKNAVRDQFVALSVSGVPDGDKGDITVSGSGIAWAIDSTAVTLAKMANLATDRLIGRDTAGTGVPEALTVGGGIEFTGSGGIQTGAFTGDVTKAAGGTATTIATDAVDGTNISISSETTGDILYFDGSNWVRLPAGTAGQVLQTNGVGVAPGWDTDDTGGGGGGITDGNKGDVTVSGSGSSWTINNTAVTYAKIQNVTTDRLLGRDTAASGVTEELTVGGGLEFTGSGGIQRSALTGNVTASAGNGATAIANNVVTGAMIALGSDAQGDVMYYNGTDWARLAAGTDGQVLHTHGAGQNPTWDADDGAGGGAPTDVDYLVGTASGSLSTEIVVGTSPGGELGGTWAAPTIDDGISITNLTMVTPVLGTPTSGTLTNATGLPISTGVSGLGTGVATFLATPSSANLAAALTDETGTGVNVMATSPTLVTPNLGTPSAVVLTNATGLPVSTGVSGLGTGVATFLATPSSANLAGAVTDETGSGSAVFATSPTITTLTVSGAFTMANGFLYTDAAMGALAIDTAELNNTKTISADSTLTFSSTPGTGAVFGLQLTNSDTAAHTITIPSSKSEALGGTARTSFTIAPSQTVTLKWRYEGSSVYTVWGDPVRILDLTSATVAGADSFEFYDVSDGLSKRDLISSLGNAAIITASGFNGNLATTDDTVQEVAQKVDDLTAAGGSSADSLTATHASPSATTPLSPTWTSNMHDVFYGATGTINLPAAAGYAGKRVTIYNTGAFTITLVPGVTEVIVREGSVQTAGWSMTLASGAGNYVELVCDGVRWITLDKVGTLALGSAPPSAGGWFDNGTFAATTNDTTAASEVGGWGTVGGPVTPSSSGSCTKVRVYLGIVNANGTLKAALYDNSGNLMGSGSVAVSTGTSNQFYEVTLGTPQSVTASTPYIVAYMVSATALAQGRYVTGSSGVGKVNFSAVYSTFPASSYTFSDTTQKELVGMWVE